MIGLPAIQREAPQRDVIDYLEVPFRRWRYVAGTMMVTLVAAFGLFSMTEKRYKSVTVILVESQAVPDTVAPHAATNPAQRLGTIKQEILSRTRLERVLAELNPYPRLRKTKSLAQIVDTMRASIWIGVKGQDSFSVEFSHPSPQMAMAVTNRLAGLFIAETLGAHEREVAEAYKFIESELQSARRELETHEAAISHYKQAHLGSLPEQLQTNVATLTRLQLEQQSLGDSLRSAEDRKAALDASLASRLQEVKPTVESAAPTELTRLEAQLATLRQRYTELHPEVRQLRKRIDGLQAERDYPTTATGPPGMESPAIQLLRGQIEGVRLDIDNLKTKRDNLATRVDALQRQVDQTPQADLDLRSLNRDTGRLQENYSILLNKRADAQMAGNLARQWGGDRFRILDPANLPDRPASPNRKLFLALGVFLGLAGGLGLAVLAEFLDDSVHSTYELAALVPYPVLVTIPRLSASTRHDLPVVAADDRA